MYRRATPLYRQGAGARGRAAFLYIGATPLYILTTGLYSRATRVTALAAPMYIGAARLYIRAARMSGGAARARGPQAPRKVWIRNGSHGKASEIKRYYFTEDSVKGSPRAWS